MRYAHLVAIGIWLPNVTFAGIEWQVERPFRMVDEGEGGSFFKMQVGQSVLEFVTERLSASSNVSPFPFKKAVVGGVQSSYGSMYKIRSYVFPRSVGATATLVPSIKGDCLWAYGGVSTVQPCNSSYKFDVNTQFGAGDHLLSVTVQSSGENVTVEAVAKDRLVLGIGDSYASGEGNPDRPSTVSREGVQRLYFKRPYLFQRNKWLQYQDDWMLSAPEWLDGQCHRSMLSQHVLAAIKLAGYDPHGSITLLPLACSGAEIMDGILTPQTNPPGGGGNLESQVNFAIAALCRDGRLGSGAFTLNKGKSGTDILEKINIRVNRCLGEIRTPDAILISAGGNDVAFSSNIAWAVIPPGHRNIAGMISVSGVLYLSDPVCPRWTNVEQCKKTRPVTKERIERWLPSYYKYLNEQIVGAGLSSPTSANVFITAYPNPTFLEDGKTLCDADRSKIAVEQAVYEIPPILNPSRWDLQITKGELEAINSGFVLPLAKMMEKSAKANSWILVDDFIETVNSHGFCARALKNTKVVGNAFAEVAEYDFPRINEASWVPIPPWRSGAYDLSRMRWFRDTNDSLLYQNDGSATRMNGAFHPDARAHAVIADSLYKKISAVWDLKTLSK